MSARVFSSGLLAALTLMGIAAACSSSSSDSPTLPVEGGAGADSGERVPTATTGTVARGQYLVDHVLVCGVCHTPGFTPANAVVSTLYFQR